MNKLKVIIFKSQYLQIKEKEEKTLKYKENLKKKEKYRCKKENGLQLKTVKERERESKKEQR